MAHNLRKEIKDLEKTKLKIQAKGNLLEEAKICNALGDLYSKCGESDKAVTEHRTELRLCESLSRPIDVAVAHRKLGECLCQSGQYEEGIQHQQEHLKIAQENGDLKEKQRALATVGRTCFLWAQEMEKYADERDKLMEAQKAYFESWRVCDVLGGDVSERELEEMKARLYLNLGLVLEALGNPKRAKQFMGRALKIAKDQGLRETQQKSHVSLGGLYLLMKEPFQGLREFEAALEVTKLEKDSFGQAEALEGIGQSYLVLGNLDSAKDCYRKAYKMTEGNLSDQAAIVKILKVVCKAVKLERELLLLRSDTNVDLKDLMVHWDRLGDLCSKLKAYKKAIECYQNELQIGSQIGMAERELASIYVSLAVTFDDDGQYEKAVEFYMKELAAMEDNPLGEADSWCFIGKIHADARHSKLTVCDSYEKALGYATEAGNVKKQVKVLRQWLAVCTDKGFADKVEEIQERLAELGDLDGSSDEEGEENTESQSLDCDDINESDLDFLESDESDGDGETSEGRRQKRKRTSTSNIHKVNQKGETRLQQACIAGNVRDVTHLLSQGASVLSRDYCGWTPLHEACNFGYLEIAEMLLDYGAVVNDPGGKDCKGTTPLHDAAVNGHRDVVCLLVDRGADVFQKDKNGHTPLDSVLSYLSVDDDTMDDSQDSDLNQCHKEVAAFLQHVMAGRGGGGGRGQGRRRIDGAILGYEEEKEIEETILVSSDGEDSGGRNQSPPALISESGSDVDSPPMDIDCVVLSNDEDQSPCHRTSYFQRGDNTDGRPALISENGSERLCENDWLVDDVTPAPKKRKLLRKKKRRSPLEKTVPDDEQDGSNDDVIIETQRPNVRNELPLSNNPPMRVRVSVEDKTFVIPCLSALKDGCPATIGWLAAQASDRYYRLCGRKPRLRLETKADSALFNSDDEIGFVLGNNEELVGCVEDWNLPPLHERYRAACQTAGQDPIPELCKILEQDSDPRKLALTDFCLAKNATEPLLRSLQLQKSLTSIDFSGNEIDDCGMESLATALISLPEVMSLNLALNLFTSSGIQRFVGMVAGGGGGEFRKLSSLDLSYNQLDDSLALCLGNAFSCWPSLTELKLISCGLTSAFMAPRSVLQVARLRHLSVAHNGLGPSGVKEILCLLDCSWLQTLDISFTHPNDHDKVPGYGQGRIGKSLADVYSNLGESNLQCLNMADSCLTDLDIECLNPLLQRSSHCLKTLDVSCNQLGQQSVLLLSQWMSEVQALERLDLSCSFAEDAAPAFLQASVFDGKSVECCQSPSGHFCLVFTQ